MSKPLRLLAVRNDRLGDFMLAWPALQTLHLNLPHARLTVLARAYTAPLAGLCGGVTDVICDPGKRRSLANAVAVARLVSPRRFAASVSFFSRFDTAMGLALARIPLRVAPATKIAQIFYTHRLRQRRSRSLKPEYLYNLELAEYLLALLGISRPVRAGPPYLRFTARDTAAARAALASRLNLPAERPMVFVHPGHGGSAPAPPVELFARIARGVAATGASVVVSAGPADNEAVAALEPALAGIRYGVYRSQSDLVEYARTLACADLFLSGSTGPLHIAGALNRPTAAFYPRRRSASAVRWQTLNEETRRLAYAPPPEADGDDYAAIDADKVLADVRMLLRAAPDRANVATNPRT